MPRHIQAFGENMRERSVAAADDLESAAGGTRDMSNEMTLLTYDILQATIFSGDIPDDPRAFATAVSEMLKSWRASIRWTCSTPRPFVPRLRIIRGRRWLDHVRGIIREAMARREAVLRDTPDKAPNDFLTLLLQADGLSQEEIEDNIITFIGAGHETTARGLAWGLYLLSQAPEERALVEAEIDAHDFSTDPARWGDVMPYTKALFEESMRLYPPIPSLNRTAVEADRIGEMDIPKGAAVLVLPWVYPPPPEILGQARRIHAVALPPPPIAARSTAFSICRSGPGRASASAALSACRKASSPSPASSGTCASTMSASTTPCRSRRSPSSPMAACR